MIGPPVVIAGQLWYLGFKYEGAPLSQAIPEVFNVNMQNFNYQHLPQALQGVSMRFAQVAQYLAATLPPGDEREFALRKLLESKDCAVRARLETMQAEGKTKIREQEPPVRLPRGFDDPAVFDMLRYRPNGQVLLLAEHTPLDIEHARQAAYDLRHAVPDEDIPNRLHRIVTGRYVTFDPIDSFYDRLCGALQKENPPTR